MNRFAVGCVIGSIFGVLISVNVWADWIQDGGSLNLNPSMQANTPTLAVYGGVPYVAWTESDGVAIQVYIKHYNGSSWIQDGGSLNVNSVQHAFSPQIAFVDDVPHVVWRESNGANDVMYVKRFNGTDWGMEDILNIDGSKNAILPSLAVYDNVPYVAWEEQHTSTSINQIYVKHYNGSAWVQDGTGSLNIDAGTNASNPHIGMAGSIPYVSWVEGGTNIYVKHCIGGFWIQDGSAVDNQIFNDHDLAILDSVPYVAFSSNASGGKLLVKRYNGAGWVQVGNTLGANASALPQIEIVGTTPYVTYQKNIGAGIDTIFVKHLVVDQWVTDSEGLNLDLSRYARYPQIAANGSTPYVTWHEDYGVTATQQQIYVKHLDGIVPTVSMVLPDHGLQGSLVNIQLVGPYFISPFVVKLVRSGSTEEIIATSSELKKDTMISATFNLGAASPGYYDIKVESNNQQDSIERAFIVLEPQNQQYQWSIQDLGTITTPSIGGNLGGLTVGDADNDDSQELYIANRNQNLFRMRKINSNWTITSLPAGVVGEYYNDVLVLDGDSDSAREVYGGTYNNHLYQFSGTTWSKVDTGETTDKIYSMTKGDGNNDGWPEIYTGCADGYIYQFKKLNDWNKSELGSVEGIIYDLAVGDGNGDGDFEVYAACSDRNVYQFKYDVGTWTKTVIGSGAGEMSTVVTADANRDGAIEVYASNEDGKLYQFKWQVTSWEKTEVATLGGSITSLICNDGENIGIDTLFAACEDGHVYQFKRENNQWVTNDLGVAPSVINHIAIGDADNDNIFEIYALGQDNHIYQFELRSFNPTPTPIPGFKGKIISKKYIYAAPNPIRGHTANIHIYTKQPAEVSAKLFTTSNQEVLSFRRNYGVGMNVERINMSNLANGVYLLLVKAKSAAGTEERVIKKLALVK